MALSVERIVPEPRRVTKPAAVLPKRRCLFLRGFFFTLGCLLVGAFFGAIAATPPIRDLSSVPAVGTHTGIGAAAGALLFLAGGFMLRSARNLAPAAARQRRAPVLGALLLGALTGAFLGTMFFPLGRALGAELGALLFMLGAAANVTRGRGAGRPCTWRWALVSMCAVALGAAAVSVFFPVVRDTYTLAIPRGLLLVTLPTAVFGAIYGLLFATHTGRRRTLTLVVSLAGVLAALGMLGAYHVPVRELRFPEGRPLGEIHYAHWLDYVLAPAQGVIRVPLYGAVCLQVTGGTAKDLSPLAGIGGLRELDLSASAVTDEQLRHAATLKNLTWLSLSGTAIGDVGLAHLAGLKNLRELWLDGCRITDAGLEALAGLRHLRQLSLENTGVGDAGIAHLKALSELTSLTLFGTRVTDAGLGPLAQLRHLRHLDLYQTAVTPAGVAAMRRHLPHCRIIAPPAAHAPGVLVEAAPQSADAQQPLPAPNTAALNAAPAESGPEQ